MSIDKFGNATGPAATVPATPIMTANEIAQAEAARAQADAERAATLTIEAQMRLASEKGGQGGKG
ncbi:MAG: hypothetical protein ACHQQS_06605 [Thermoanaerobaculales bacterium]